MRHRMVGLVAGLSLLAAGAIGAITVLPAPPAQAAYPGRDGKIAYVIASPGGTSHDIWTVNPTGPATAASPPTARAGIPAGRRTAN